MKRILMGMVVGLVALVSTNAWSYTGDQPVMLNDAKIGATITVSVTGTASIRDLNSSIDSVSAIQSGNWTVSVSGTTATRYLNQSSDSIRVYGDQGVPIKQDATGQIYAITSSVEGTNISKAFTFSNISAGIWVEIGSYTVTTGKSLKIVDAQATGRCSVDYKISNGISGQELYLATAPAFATSGITKSRPVVISAGTVVRVYVKADTAINDGTIGFGGFEY